MNKLDSGKLTDRGVEVCYRLFDAGKSRNTVGAEMKISFGVATHRFEAWKTAGGLDRKKQPLTKQSWIEGLTYNWGGGSTSGSEYSLGGDHGPHGSMKKGRKHRIFWP